MPRVLYDPRMTLRAARAEYFEKNGLGDGGYDQRWVVFRVRGIPVAVVPNTAQRVRSVRLHDLHHVLTGYDTSWTGESEVAAWELASGCASHSAAWILNTLAALIGLVVAPRAMLAAAQRGRTARNLYSGEWDEALLDRSVGELRSELRLESDPA